MNKQQKKKLLEMLQTLEMMVGANATGIIIASLLDGLNEFSAKQGVVEVRSLKFVVNNYFEIPIVEGANK